MASTPIHPRPKLRPVRAQVLLALLLVVSPAGLRAQVHLDPATAPEEYRIQGEYLGDITGGGRLGAWVVAQGGDSYQVSFLPGGLVGLGWNGQGRVPGVGSAAALAASGYTGRITGTGLDRTLAGKTPDGRAFTLKRLARHSPAAGIKPPAGARVLYGDKASADAANWNPADRVDPASRLLMEGVRSKLMHRNLQVHLEFRTPFKPAGRGQDRGNSGMYFQDRYEVQILDSFGLDGLDNEMGGIYTVSRPRINAALPPLAWQTYDAYFKEPEWGPAGKLRNARVTVYLNGILIQEDVEVPKATVSAGLPEGSGPGPLHLQDHGNPVRYNNVWVLEGETIPFDRLLPPTAMDRKAGLAPPRRTGPLLRGPGLFSASDGFVYLLDGTRRRAAGAEGGASFPRGLPGLIP